MHSNQHKLYSCVETHFNIFNIVIWDFIVSGAYNQDWGFFNPSMLMQSLGL